MWIRSTRSVLHLALIGALSGCLRLGYDPVRTHPPAAASDAAVFDAAPDTGGGSDAMSDAASGTPAYRGEHDAGSVAPDGSVAGGKGDDASDAADKTLDAAADGGGAQPCTGSVNACGGCTVLSATLGSACGACDIGQYVCSGSDALSCSGGSSTPTTIGGALLLDDFDDGDRFFRAGPINGSWYLVSDATAGTLNPSSDDELPTKPGANDSAGALHVSGSGFTSWGAGIQGGLNIDGCYVDLTAQTGVSFYARGSGTLLFSVATKQTIPTADGGTCIGTCYDNFEFAIVLTNTWKSYSVPWSMLHQAGWGTAATFRLNQIKYLQFSFAAGTSLDLYLDEVSFY